MVHIGIKSYSYEEFEKNFGDISKSLKDLTLLILARDSDNYTKYSDFLSSLDMKGNVYFTTCRKLTEFLDSEFGIYYDDYVGYSKGTMNNMLFLFSHILSDAEDLIVFSSRVNLLPKIGYKYFSALKANPLVIGNVLGHVQNPLIATIKFFECLDTKDYTNAKAILSGNWNFRKKGEINKSLNSENFAIQGKFKISNHFSDNDYFSDHFYEFTFYLINKTRQNIISEEEVPEVFMESYTMSYDYLFVELINYLKASMIEHYFFYNTLQCYPIVVDNKFSLLKVDKFNLNEVVEKVINESKIMLFKSKAETILKNEKNLDEEIENQLKNFLWLEKKDLTPKIDDLIVSWTAYQEQGYKFSEIVKRNEGKKEETKRKVDNQFQIKGKK
ncbi:MAG: hypothetical protein QXO21_02395 [Candidatus Anstonellales archaeon]